MGNKNLVVSEMNNAEKVSSYWRAKKEIKAKQKTADKLKADLEMTYTTAEREAGIQGTNPNHRLRWETAEEGSERFMSLTDLRNDARNADSLMTPEILARYTKRCNPAVSVKAY
jgi:hypothetical protein